ncbi:MAG: DUF6106 family protein [Eubacteriales bacterium]|nr:DUF6106 family protein [Eubacteriales bacterium]
MSDLYSEEIVKKNPSAKDRLLKVLLPALTVVSAAMALFTGLNLLLLVLTIALIVADALVIPRLSVEYEYLYVNGELDVDKIMSKQKRKRVYSMEVSELELMAPTSSHALDYHNQQSIKTYDFSSGSADAETFTMIVMKDKERERVIFEPNETMKKDMKRLAPREVQLS